MSLQRATTDRPVLSNRLMAMCVALGLGASTITAAAADWPQFRGPDSRSVSVETRLPTSFDAATGENVAWKAPLPGCGPSSPVVIGDRVVVTCSGPASRANQDRLQVLCFRAADGQLLWQRQLWATGHALCNPFGGVAAPTPASDGRLLVVFFSSNDLACFDLEGNLQWLRGLAYESPDIRNDVGMASSPLLVGDTVIAEMDSEGESAVLGIDKTTGVTRWQVPRERAALWTSPILLHAATTEHDIILLQSRTELTAHDPKTGKLVWRFAAPCHTVSSLTTSGDRVYLPAIGLYALKYDPAAKSVQRLWYEDRLRSDNCSPVVYDSGVLVIKPPGILMCADLADGKLRWQLRLKGPFWATPVVAQGHAICVNHDGLVQIVDLTGEGKVAATAQLDAGVLASPAVAHGAIYFRSQSQLWKIAATKSNP